MLDGTTLEWTDGVFTGVLRQVLNNVRGEASRRQWIVFDGDVDPEWAENLNSVLDDNRLLTLPSGERLAIPSNVRIMFEVESLKYAAGAGVARERRSEGLRVPACALVGVGVGAACVSWGAC